MKSIIHTAGFILLFALVAFYPKPSRHFPYKKAGLTEREAAAHLLSRFTFGAKPQQLDEVLKTGLEKWFDQQLTAAAPDDSLHNMLSAYESLTMSNAEIAQTYLRPGKILKMATQDGSIVIDSAAADAKDYKEQIRSYMQANGYKPQAELTRQLINQKILRAAYSNNQLQEVLTDFWFNHFNVSMTKGASRDFITAYERDAIRPHVLGNFEDLLIATAQSPAMLTYLDNFKSVAADSIKKTGRAQGLNENYAREIMELHTLGVDGGYTQADVTNAAKILTGWTFIPPEKKLDNKNAGDFFFAAKKHDNGEKTVLKNYFPPNGGYEEGLRLLHILATHPSTARFISKELAMHFVSDDPPASLIDKMAKTFMDKKGNIKEVLLTMVHSSEFWDKKVIGKKTKSPFELAISSIRSIDAQLIAPYPLNNWVTKMGEQLYSCQAPTGFPDRGQYWINTGSLMNRMNFELTLSSKKIPGVRINNESMINEIKSPEFQRK